RRGRPPRRLTRRRDSWSRRQVVFHSAARESAGYCSLRGLELVVCLPLLGSHQADRHEVERTDEAVTDPEAARTHDRVAQRHRPVVLDQDQRDRKSTRLNSSHEWISYAVFCLKKKNKA